MQDQTPTDDQQNATLHTLLAEAHRKLDRTHRTLRQIRDMHAQPRESGASCREGCGGRWPCATYAEAAGEVGAAQRGMPLVDVLADYEEDEDA